jgi:hypothetical protein
MDDVEQPQQPQLQLPEPEPQPTYAPYKPASKDDKKPIPDPTRSAYAAKECFSRGPIVPLSYDLSGDEPVAKTPERMRAEWDAYYLTVSGKR